MRTDQYKNEVVRFFKCYNKVVLQQFGTTILYLPIYLLISELREKYNINIEIQSSGSNDDETVGLVSKVDNDFIDEYLKKREITFGLSELRYKKNEFHSFGFIQRAPIWGIALKNNKKINEIKASKDNIDLYSYWDIFGSKFSLLHKNDFKGLTVSLYPHGSTVYRIFEEYLSNDISEVILAPHTLTVKEFDDLFSGAADVCLTVHPAYAIARSIKEKIKIEVVFNYFGPPMHFTDFYIKKFGDAGKDDILKNLMKCMQVLVNEKISYFYQNVKEYQNNSKKFIQFEEINCNASNESVSCLISEMVGTKICGDSYDCSLPATISQQIVNDSRIYYYENTGKDTMNNNEEIKLREIVTDWEKINYIKNGPEKFDENKKDELISQYYLYEYINEKENVVNLKDEYLYQDPIYLMSKYWKLLPTNDVHGENGVKINQVHQEYIHRLLDMTLIHDVKTDNENEIITPKILLDKYIYYEKKDNIEESYDRNINLCWRIEDLSDLLSTLPAIKNRIEILTDTETFRIVFQKEIIKYAFGLLNTDFENKKNNDGSYRMTPISSKIKLLYGDISKDKKHCDILVCLLIIYKINNENKHSYKCPGCFVNENIVGSAILNAYWFKGKNNPIPYFKRISHGEYKNNALWYYKEHYSVIDEIDNDSEAWLFTFKTYGDNRS